MNHFIFKNVLYYSRKCEESKVKGFSVWVPIIVAFLARAKTFERHFRRLGSVPKIKDALSSRLQTWLTGVCNRTFGQNIPVASTFAMSLGSFFWICKVKIGAEREGWWKFLNPLKRGESWRSHACEEDVSFILSVFLDTLVTSFRGFHFTLAKRSKVGKYPNTSPIPSRFFTSECENEPTTA